MGIEPFIKGGREGKNYQKNGRPNLPEGKGRLIKFKEKIGWKEFEKRKSCRGGKKRPLVYPSAKR